MALLIPWDDRLPIREVQPENGTDFRLRQLYQLLDCSMIEVIPLPDRAFIMVIDDEGKLIDKPRNERATRLAAFPSVRECVDFLLRMQAAGVHVIRAAEPLTDTMTETDYIAGDVLVCRDDELK